MPISVTEAFREAAASASYDVVTITTMTLTHSLFPEPFRVARNEFNIRLGGQLYFGKQFDFSLPETAAKTNNNLSISVSNISGIALSFIDQTVETTEPILVAFNEWILGEAQPQAGFDEKLEVINVGIKGNDLTVTAAFPDIINRKFPRVKYTTEAYPGLR